MRPVETRWSLARIPPEAEAREIPALTRTLGVSPLVGRLLWLRGVCDEARGRAFLLPRLKDLAPPSALVDADRAAARVADAVRGESASRSSATTTWTA